MIPAIKKAFKLLGDDIVELSVENESLKSQIGEYDEKRPQESKAKLLKDIDDEKKANLVMWRMKNQMNKQYQMAYISYNELWENEFDGIASKRDKLQDLNINQLKVEIHDTYKKDEKISTNFEPVDNEDVINKGFLDGEPIKINGHLSKLEKDYNEFKLQYNKQNVEDILIQRGVKTTIQILYDKGLFDNYANADKVLEDFSYTTRRKGDLSEQLNDIIQ